MQLCNRFRFRGECSDRVSVSATRALNGGKAITGRQLECHAAWAVDKAVSETLSCRTIAQELAKECRHLPFNAGFVRQMPYHFLQFSTLEPKAMTSGTAVDLNLGAVPEDYPVHRPPAQRAFSGSPRCRFSRQFHKTIYGMLGMTILQQKIQFHNVQPDTGATRAVVQFDIRVLNHNHMFTANRTLHGIPPFRARCCCPLSSFTRF